MDTAVMNALLKAYGGDPSNPQHVNALQQRYASDPTAAERKIYGLQGQSDESGGSRDAILNMMIDQTLEPALPQGEVTVGAPVMESVANSSAPTRRSATAARQPVDPRQLSNSPPSSGDPLANEVNQRTPANPSPAPPASGGSGWEWLLPLLGFAAARTSPTVNAAAEIKGGLPAERPIPEATYDGPMRKNIVPGGDRVVGPTDRIGVQNGYWEDDLTAIGQNKRVGDGTGKERITETKKLEKTSPSVVTDSTDENVDKARKSQGTSGKNYNPERQSPEDRARMQAELDAANAKGNSIQKQLLEKKRGKQWTPELMRRAFGR